MKLIYGLRMIDLEDITGHSNVGRPAALCDYVQDMVKKNDGFLGSFDKVVTVDTSLSGNMPIPNIIKSYKLVFIPINVIEEKIMADGVLDYLNFISDKIVTDKRARRIDSAISSCENKLQSVSGKYLTDESILFAGCCMFIFDGDNFINVYTVRSPASLIKDIFFKKEEYVCSHCKSCLSPENKDIQNFLPEMRYEIKDGEILYYCEPCTEGHGLSNLRHVGE